MNNNEYKAEKLKLIVEEHRNNGDFPQFLQALYETDGKTFCAICDFGFLSDSEISSLIKPLYAKRIEENRESGTLVDYMLEEIDRTRSDYSSEHYGIFRLDFIKTLLTEREFDEIELICKTLFSRNKAVEDKLTKYLYALSKKKIETVEYKRYQKLREKIRQTDIRVFERIDKQIKTRPVKTLIRSVSMFVLAVVLVFGAVFIKEEVKKMTELRKIEEQKAAEKAAQEEADRIWWEKLNAVTLKDILVPTSEPDFWVVAPMSYDLTEFTKKYTSAMLGFADASYRVAVLKNCINNFINVIDSDFGVSIVDRTKIEQIEKEHSFQLGDWSNGKKTAEIGKALNATTLLVLNNFSFTSDFWEGTCQYNFDASIIDINTMKVGTLNVAYENNEKAVGDLKVRGSVNWRDFAIHSKNKNSSFEDEISLKTLDTIATVQTNDISMVSPLGHAMRLEENEYDLNDLKTEFAQALLIYFDGVGELELKSSRNSKKYIYTFEACEPNIEKIDGSFYTDGKIGTLSVKTSNGLEKLDVYTINNSEYFIKIGTEKYPACTAYYFLKMIKE